MTKLDQTQLNQIVAAVMAVLGNTSAKPTTTQFLPRGSKAAPSDLASKDAAIVNAFHRKGFKDVVLMDRSDKSKAFNVRPFKGWLAEGRIVRRGQKGVKGLFHITQTDALPVKASAKPTITTEQKELFAKAKAAFTAKRAKGKAQPAASV